MSSPGESRLFISWDRREGGREGGREGLYTCILRSRASFLRTATIHCTYATALVSIEGGRPIIKHIILHSFRYMCNGMSSHGKCQS